MENRGDRARELFDRVAARFRDRQFPGITFQQQTLIAHSSIVEKRTYLILRRHLACTALFITQYGKDLYIAQLSYIKPPVSYARVLILGLMLLFALVTLFASSITSSLGTLNNLALIVFAAYSLHKFLAEKDPLAGLRMAPTEFNIDDLMAMEKSAEHTVRMVMSEIGLDPATLQPLDSPQTRRLTG